MGNFKKNWVVYIGSYGLFVVVGMIFQTTLAYRIEILGTHPNIMMPIVAMAALQDGRKTGAFLGLTAGLCLDILGRSVVGFYGLLFMAIGLAVGFCGETYLQRTVLVGVAVSAAGVLLQGLFTYAAFFLLRGDTAHLFALTHIILPELIYSSLLSVPLYFFIRFAIKGIQRAE